jgi:ABC-2 type transport system permease protein
LSDLIRNERTKLYKRVSTWVLAGIAVGLAALMLLLTGAGNLLVRSFSSGNWESFASTQRNTYYQIYRDDPTDLSAKYQMEMYQYLLENDISPSHWKYGLVDQYYTHLIEWSQWDALTDAEKTAYGKENWLSMPADQLEAAIAQEKELLENDNWKDYVKMRMALLKSGQAGIATEAEKQVELEIWQMYLDLDLPPISTEYSEFLDEQTVWKQAQIQQIRQNKLALESFMPASQREDTKMQVELSTERLRTDTPPVSSGSMYGLMDSALSSSSGMLALLMLVICAITVSTEFGGGTIKLLLIAPHRRQEIFWSKVWVATEMMLWVAGATFAVSFLLGGLLGGFGGIGAWYMAPLFGSIVRLPYAVVMVYKHLLFLLPVIAYGAMGLMFSTVIRKPAGSVALSLVTYYVGSTVSGVLTLVSIMTKGDLPGSEFLLFTNTDLSGFFGGTSVDIEMLLAGITNQTNSHSIFFSIAVMIVYAVCFLWIARDSFCRRDVK